MLCASILQRIDTKDDRRLSLSPTELTSLSEEISKLLKQKEENDQHNEMIADLETRIEMLTSKMTLCKERNQSEMEYLNLTLENRTDELKRVQQQHDAKDTSYKQMKKEIQKRENELEEKDSLIRRHEQDVVILKDEVDRLTKKVNTLKGEKEKHNKKIEIEIEEKQNRIVKFNDDVSVKTFEVEDPTEALEKEMERMRKENEKLKRKLDEVKWQMKAKDIMISNGEDTMEALDNQAEEIETLQDRVKELEEQVRQKDSGEANSVENSEVDVLRMKVKEMEMKLRQRDDTIQTMDENRRNEEINNNRTRSKIETTHETMVIEKMIMQPIEQPVLESAPEPKSREDEYLQMLITLRDSFFTEMQLKPRVQNGKGHFETVLEDLQTVLGTIRQKVSTVLEESVKENVKEVQRVQSLKKQNTTLKEEIQCKTENYNKTVNSLEIKVGALNSSFTVQQQVNEELSEKCTDAEKERDRARNATNDLKLKMMVRDAEVERLKGILDELKKTKKFKKMTKKDKRKSNSLSNLLHI